MSAGKTLFEVHWAANTAKVHKIWSTGFLTWNASNSRVSLLDEDRHQTLAESFIPKGPVIDRQYPMGSYLVKIIGGAEIEEQAPASSGLSIAQAPLRPLRPSTSALPAPKKQQLHSITAPVAPQVAQPSSSNAAPVPATSRVLAKPIRRNKPPSSLPWRPPAQIERKPSPEPEPEPVVTTSSTSVFSSNPYPVYDFTEPAPAAVPVQHKITPNYVMFDWRLFDPNAAVEVVQETPPEPSDPRISRSTFGEDTSISRALIDTPTQSDQNGRHDSNDANDELAIFHAKVATTSSRVRTFPTMGDNVVDLSTAKPRIPPPPFPFKSAPSQDKSTASSAPKSPFHTASPKVTTSKPSSSPFSLKPTGVARSSAPVQTTPDPRPMAPPALPKKKNTPPSPPAKKSSFTPPSVVNPHDGVLGFGTTLLCFPSSSTISKLPKIPRRSVELSLSYPNANEYQKQYSSALYEEMNHGLLPIAVKFHSTRSKMGGTSLAAMTGPVKQAISTKFRQAYFDCTLIAVSPSQPKHNRRGNAAPAPPPPSSSSTPAPTSIFYLKLPANSSNQENNAAFSKDDVWILSSNPDFEPSKPNEFIFLASSTMHGKSSSVMEVKPLVDGSFGSGAKTKLPKLDGDVTVHAIHASSIGTDICMLDAVCDVSTEHMPLLPTILSGKPKISQQPILRTVSSIQTDLQNYIETYSLNVDQAEVFRRVANWFQPNKYPNTPVQPIILVHGVFGSGKSHMLVILIMFLCEMIEKMGPPPDMEEDDIGMRILVSAATNTAVDRILVGLLDLGFTDFVRVGSLKRINSRVLPYSIHREKRSSKETSFEDNTSHSTGKSNVHADRSALRDLEELLHSRTLTSVERALIEQQKMEIESGSFERKIALVDQARVVGATCIATTFPILAASKFDIVILDECSQMPEPLSLLPASRFGSSAFVLVGDPLQLPPQLKSKPKIDNQDQQGLGCALFSRLAQLGVPAVLLRTQYRLHPTLSSIANQLFYGGQLLNGVGESARKPLHPSLPTLLFVECEDSSQRTTYGGSIENPMEASIINVFLQKLVLLGLEGAQIGVICLYKNQVTLLTDMITRASMSPDFESVKEELLAIQISTVDAFQGAEKDIIILSTVRTDSLGFIDSPQRLNVSLTRGRNHLIIMGSSPVLTSSSQWKVVLETARRQGPRSFISSHNILGGDFFSEV